MLMRETVDKRPGNGLVPLAGNWLYDDGGTTGGSPGEGGGCDSYEQQYKVLLGDSTTPHRCVINGQLSLCEARPGVVEAVDHKWLNGVADNLRANASLKIGGF
jgi:hypothetical protein